MKNKHSSRLFYAYRYFVVDNGQVAVADLLANNNNESTSPINSMINECVKSGNITRTIGGKENTLIHCGTASKDIHIFMFCKDIPITKFDISDTRSDIIETRESNFPFIYVVIDCVKQIILLEKRTTIYAKPLQSRNAFSNFVVEYLHHPGYVFSMDEISDISSFWDIIMEAEQVYEVSLNLKSPNLFGAAFNTNELLMRIKNITNNDEIDVSLKSNSGVLNIDDELEDPIEYAVNGGGSWKITHSRKDGIKRKISSVSKIRVIEIQNFSQHLDNNHSLFAINVIEEAIEEINDALKKKGWNPKGKNKNKD